MKLLLVLSFLVAFSSDFVSTQKVSSGEDDYQNKVVNTSGVASNIAYFHILYSYAVAEFENPFDNLLKLTYSEELTKSAKARAEQCPDADHRQISVNHNRTEFFIVSELQKHNLTAEARKRLRENIKTWPSVLPESRVVHAAFYTDMSNVAFAEDTKDEMEDLAHAMNGYFYFGCDMAVCKEDGIRKSIIACHASRAVAPPKRVISKAEYERRYGTPKGEQDETDGAGVASFVLALALLVGPRALD